MQITLVQVEIEQALKNYVNDILQVKEGQEITIDLKSTRGSDGATAIIDIVPAKNTGNKVATTVATPRTATTNVAKSETKDEPVAKTTATESNTGIGTAGPAFEPDTAAVAEAASPASGEEAGEPVRTSLFSGLSRPTNK